MFIRLVLASLDSLFGTKASEPDFETFEKMRAHAAKAVADENDKTQQTIEYASAQMSSEPVLSSPRSLFFQHLFDATSHTNAKSEDELSLFVYRHIRQLLASPELIMDHLPVMPKSVDNMLAELSNDDFNLMHFLQLVEAEPVITGALLEKANSSFFNHSNKPVTNLKKAFMLMGANQVKHFVLMSYLSQFKPVPHLYFKMFGQSLWQNAQSTAQLSHDLAKKIKLEDPASAYLVGLISEIGSMVIFQLMQDAFKVVSPDCEPNSDMFKQLIIEEAKLLTVKIAEYWNLPQSIIVALKYNPEHFVANVSLGSCCYDASVVAQIRYLYTKGFISDDVYQALAAQYLLANDSKRFAEQLNTEPLAS
ncbi:HDOD domain-containing protein [Catenovulum sp. SM1970]|uniref:HDOD domain-containing protein n=1 Tax=Marinifaba aquimaris TaxID=2741323 RepID=UPI001572D520|nr:HDOD domain-containing protein [Marinifaba aquimaris]NTS75530.1 HDOD domain-containing protein [Marinifaba aquimaris]